MSTSSLFLHQIMTTNYAFNMHRINKDKLLDQLSCSYYYLRFLTWKNILWLWAMRTCQCSPWLSVQVWVCRCECAGVVNTILPVQLSVQVWVCRCGIASAQTPSYLLPGFLSNLLYTWWIFISGPNFLTRMWILKSSEFVHVKCMSCNLLCCLWLAGYNKHAIKLSNNVHEEDVQ